MYSITNDTYYSYTLINLEKHGRRWEDNIKVDLKEIRCKDVDWILLAQERRTHLNTVIKAMVK
jgi:hypothetical protein